MVRIVVIGGGYGGIWAYKSSYDLLRSQVKRGEVEYTIIAPKPYHSFHGWTAEALTGIISVGSRQSPLRMVFKDCRILYAEATSIDLQQQKVAIRYVSDQKTSEVPYDHMVIANGSYDYLESVPGLLEHGFSLKEPGGVLSTRNHIVTTLEAAESTEDPEERARLLTFVVGGGGFAGVEIAANLAEYFQAIKKKYPVLAKHGAQVVLVHSRQQIINEIRPRYEKQADYCMRQLEKYGINMCLGNRLVEVKPEGAVLSDGSFIPSRTVIATVGQRLVPFPGTESLPTNAKKQLLTDEFFRVQGQTNIWVAGDVAEFKKPSGEIIPGNAVWAVLEGQQAGKNLALTIQKKTLKPFDVEGHVYAASLGILNGVTIVYSRPYTGLMGWFMRFMFFMMFQPSRRQAARVFGNWLTLPILGRQMTLLEESKRVHKH